jgi:outer membrane protein TolC
LSAARQLQLFTSRYEGGVDNYLQVITAQTTALANERNDIDIQRRRMDASVLLVKAVGVTAASILARHRPWPVVPDS